MINRVIQAPKFGLKKILQKDLPTKKNIWFVGEAIPISSMLFGVETKVLVMGVVLCLKSPKNERMCVPSKGSHLK